MPVPTNASCWGCPGGRDSLQGNDMLNVFACPDTCRCNALYVQRTEDGICSSTQSPFVVHGGVAPLQQCYMVLFCVSVLTIIYMKMSSLLIQCCHGPT